MKYVPKIDRSKYWTVDEFAERFGITRQTVIVHILKRKIKAIKSGRWWILKDGVEA